MTTINRRLAALLLGAAALELAGMAPAMAQTTARQTYHLEAQDLGSALRAIGRISGRQIIFPTEELAGLRAPRLEGSYTADEAIRAVLIGSNLSATFTPEMVVIRGRSQAPGQAAAPVDAQTEENAEILVTGSRIRGAPVASPVIVQTQEQMRDAGQNSLADVIRTIPQNFGGGQNPGVGIGVPEGNGVNLGSASTINLRGLGGDATLTLLNGRRLAYNITRQSIDVSTIPLGMVERIEIVADGASALYGSDAVAGVVNIILKRDFDGLSTSARFGASTDGGNEQQQYGAVGGTTWSSGGIIAAYDFQRDTPIVARQRSYAASRSPGLTLFPSLKHHNAMLSGHQSITSSLSFQVDALYNRRWSHRDYATTTAGSYLIAGNHSTYDSEAFALAPSLTLSLPRWEFNLAATYGEDRTRYGSDNYTASRLSSQTRGCYCNRAKSIELGANGALFSLPGGDAKIALGGGYRVNDFHGYRTIGAAQNIDVSQDTYYAFGELNLPLLSPAQNVPMVYRLNLSGAVRYEDYSGVDQVTTPKIGLIYAPTPDIEVKGSWGKSFKAPTLYLQYNSRSAALYTAASRGGVGYPPTATAIALSGGNRSLKPERATTWSATVVLRPSWFEGFRLEASYFDIRYRDRVVAPIAYLAQALSNPIYRDLVNFNPSDADKAAALAGANFGNATSTPYDPAAVVAIINNSNVNAARQTINGVDVLGEYRTGLGDYGSLTVSLNGSYLKSSQQLSSLQPVVNLAGNLFNPPHFRGRGGFSWNAGSLTFTSYANYIGGVEDVRAAPSVRVGSMTTVDLTARYRIEHGPRIFRDTVLTLSAKNLLNDVPSLIRTTQQYETPFDSTNYSAVGRFVSFAISKQW